MSPSQVTSLFGDGPSRIKKQFDYKEARTVLLPLLPQREKQDHTYTHMFTPLIAGCGGGSKFVQKIKMDFLSIHSAPHPSSERLLIQIHSHAGENVDNFPLSMYVFIRYVGRASLYVRRYLGRDNVVMIPTTQIQNCTSGVTGQLRRIKY